MPGVQLVEEPFPVRQPGWVRRHRRLGYRDDRDGVAAVGVGGDEGEGAVVGGVAGVDELLAVAGEVGATLGVGVGDER